MWPTKWWIEASVNLHKAIKGQWTSWHGGIQGPMLCMSIWTHQLMNPYLRHLINSPISIFGYNVHLWWLAVVGWNNFNNCKRWRYDIWWWYLDHHVLSYRKLEKTNCNFVINSFYFKILFVYFNMSLEPLTVVRPISEFDVQLSKIEFF